MNTQHMPLSTRSSRKLGLCIPLGLFDPEQAMMNHNQSLEMLRDRGGLGLEEAAALIERRNFFSRRITEAEALEVLRPHLCLP